MGSGDDGNAERQPLLSDDFASSRKMRLLASPERVPQAKRYGVGTFHSQARCTGDLPIVLHPSSLPAGFIARLFGPAFIAPERARV
jgi:hypothetical protein